MFRQTWSPSVLCDRRKVGKRRGRVVTRSRWDHATVDRFGMMDRKTGPTRGNRGAEPPATESGWSRDASAKDDEDGRRGGGEREQE